MKRFSNIMLPQKFAPHDVVKFPAIRVNIDSIIAENGFDTIAQQEIAKNCIAWLYAIDLFNHGYYWEVHAVLEALWLKFDNGEQTAQFLQAFIQLSASLLKYKEKKRKGAKELYKSAQSKKGLYSDTFGVEFDALLTYVGNMYKGKVDIFPQIELK